MINLNNKKVLVTGGTGMVGQALVKQLMNKGAIVTIVSLDDPSLGVSGLNFISADLRDFRICLEITKDIDIIFHVAGVKGSPVLTKTQPASFFVPMLQFNTNILEAARLNNVEWTLYTSTVGVYGPAKVFKEDDLWNSFPSENDWFAGWAKRIGELQIEAYNIQHQKSKYSIIRPVNIYGKYDNFNPATSMVIPSLIHRALNATDTLEVWGDGSPIRDFVNSEDVAAAMIFCVENEITQPVNIGSGTGISIKELVETINNNLPKPLNIVWNTDKPSGDVYRVADTTRINNLGFIPKVSLNEGIKETMQWYLDNKEILGKRYEVFNER